jgi:SOS-response transcriptional repressor LexA
MIDTPTQTKSASEDLMIPQRKQLILNFIHEYRRVRQISPSFDEIAKGIGFSETSGGTAHTYTESLIKEGWLKRVQAGSRSILPTKPGSESYAEITDPNLKKIAKQQRNLRILRRL